MSLKEIIGDKTKARKIAEIIFKQLDTNGRGFLEKDQIEAIE